MLYVIPFSLIALLPSVVFCLMNDLFILAAVDILSFGMCLYLAFGPGISVKIRKLVLIYCTYAIATVMLIHVGAHGPGLLFIYAATIFALLILPKAYAYHWTWLNLAICLIFALVLEFNWSPVPEVNMFESGIWLLISSNLVFLSLLCSALIPKLFDGLADTFQKLETKNKELEEFAYVASHDLQEPLRMITSFLSQLEKKYSDKLDNKAHQYIHFAVDGAQRMKLIIRDLLEYSSANQDLQPPETIDLNEIVEDFRLIHKKRMTTANAELISDPLPILRTHRTPVTQVFHNLLDNALKYAKADEPVSIYILVIDQNRFWEFCIEDNGIGIDSENFEKIFVMFQRLHSREMYSGTGIGLAIVKKSVELLGGSVRVISELGIGSRFYFTLPKS
jgi:signal transduction histidine kinase